MSDLSLFSESLARKISNRGYLAGSILHVNHYSIQFISLGLLPGQAGSKEGYQSFHCFEVRYMLDGSCRIRQKGQVFNLQPGQFMLLRPGDSYTYVPSTDCRAFSLRWLLYPQDHQCSSIEVVHEPIADLHQNLLSSKQQGYTDQEHHLLHLFAALLERTEQKEVISFQLGLLEWLYCLAERIQYTKEASTSKLPDQAEERSADARVQACIRYMDSHFSLPLSTRDIADHAGLGYGHLSRLFRRTTGMTIGEYLVMARLRHAQDLLESSSETIHTVSARCGFSHINYFSLVFKKRFGLSPSAYRRAHRQP